MLAIFFNKKWRSSPPFTPGHPAQERNRGAEPGPSRGFISVMFGGTGPANAWAGAPRHSAVRSRRGGGDVVQIFSAGIRTFVPIAASGATLRACRSRWQLRIQRRGHGVLAPPASLGVWRCPHLAPPLHYLAGQVRVDWPLRHAAPGAPLVGVGWGSGLLGMTNARGWGDGTIMPMVPSPDCELRSGSVDCEPGGDPEPSSQVEGRLRSVVDNTEVVIRRRFNA
jgi:hypothetical protein